MKLAREGWEIVGGVGIAALLLTSTFGGGAWWAWLLLAFVLQFFREPEREINPTTDSILAPADGRIVFVGRAPSPLTKESNESANKSANAAGESTNESKTASEEMLKISIFMNVFNVHANYAPVFGKVVASQPFVGKFFNAAIDKASLQNERHQIVIDSPLGTVVCTQIAGFVARRILCYAKVGDDLTAGQRYGFIRFGSRVDVYLPPSCQPAVMIGEKVTAKLTTLARPVQSDDNSKSNDGGVAAAESA